MSRFDPIRALQHIALIGLVLCVVVIGTAPVCRADELVPRDLSNGDMAIIIGTAAASFALGHVLASRTHLDSVTESSEPPAIDRWFRRRLHGANAPRTNFLDNKLGSAISPTAGLLVMGAIDVDRREFSRDIPIFLAGALTTKGITDITKGLVKRTRPCCRARGNGEYSDPHENGDHSHSFFSGHASSAFFTSTFLNRRLRRHMRQEWTNDEYHVGRVVSPIITFGWATFVGMSRIHADRHYFTDVAAGALAGAVMGEVFYRLAYATLDSDTSTAATPLFVVRIPIP